MAWENVGIKHDRLNGLKLRVAPITPETSIPKYIDNLLKKDGIDLLSDKELERRLKELEVVVS